MRNAEECAKRERPVQDAAEYLIIVMCANILTAFTRFKRFSSFSLVWIEWRKKEQQKKKKTR